MRLIDADALELILNNAIEMMRTMAKALDSEDDPEIQMEIKAYTDILTGVKEQQTAQPERKRGKWKSIGWSGRIHKCNQCGNMLDFDGVNAGRGDANFCPNCGADMRGGETT